MFTELATDTSREECVAAIKREENRAILYAQDIHTVEVEIAAAFEKFNKVK
jgi:hypothetical protein